MYLTLKTKTKELGVNITAYFFDQKNSRITFQFENVGSFFINTQTFHMECENFSFFDTEVQLPQTFSSLSIKDGPTTLLSLSANPTDENQVTYIGGESDEEEEEESIPHISYYAQKILDARSRIPGLVVLYSNDTSPDLAKRYYPPYGCFNCFYIKDNICTKYKYDMLALGSKNPNFLTRDYLLKICLSYENHKSNRLLTYDIIQSQLHILKDSEL